TGKANAMTTTNKFNPKLHQEKPRVYRPVPGAPRVLRLYVWDTGSQEYQPKGYEARRYEIATNGQPVRKKKSFDALDEARKWQMGVEPQTNASTANFDLGPTFSDIVDEW